MMGNNMLYFIKWGVCVVIIGLLAAYSLGFISPGAEFVTDFTLAEDEMSYTGYIVQGKLSGEGTITYANGDMYQGTFENGRFHGPGVFRAAEGWRFEGTFENGEAAGGGVFYDSPDGAAQTNSITLNDEGEVASVTTEAFSYIGAVDRLGQTGAGEMRFGENEVYIGDFQAGLAHGRGVYLTADGEVIYQGAFDEGLFHGYGVLTPPGGVYEYRGEFIHGLFEGYGEYLADGQLVYKGDFAQGLPHGVGVYYALSGEVYTGVFEQGLYIGELDED